MAAKSIEKKKPTGGKPTSKHPKDKFDKKRKHQDKEQTPANKKRALKAERQSHRRHASTVRPAKEVWSNLRIKSNDAATNSKLCTELYDMLKGKLMEVAMQHDASRMVQAILQFGSKEERLEAVRELCANDKEQNVNLAELCKIQYAHFVVLKMIKYCGRDEECVRLIVKVSSSYVDLPWDGVWLANDEYSYISQEVDLYCHDLPNVD
jgi:pumilio family protein 6